MEHDPRLASSRLHADVDRLRAQAILSWPREVKALFELGLRDGMTVLEVGSGPGFVTEFLLDALPHSLITAVELDPDMVAVAQERLGGDRFEIVQASILNTDLADDEFDFALARLVLQHVAAPDLALQEIRRLLKPGGTVAVLDIDDGLGGIITPSLAAFGVVADRVRQVQAGQGGDREIGRKLWRLMAEAGFVDLRLEAIVYHSGDVGLEPFLTQYAPERYRPFLTPGGLTVDEFDDYRRAYDRFVASPDAFILQLMLLASGRKPPGAGERG